MRKPKFRDLLVDYHQNLIIALSMMSLGH